MGLTVLVAAAVVCAAQNQAHVSVDLIGRVAGGVFARVTDVPARLVGGDRRRARGVRPLRQGRLRDRVSARSPERSPSCIRRSTTRWVCRWRHARCCLRTNSFAEPLRLTRTNGEGPGD